nr:sce7726 family protein [Methylobacterium sp. Leaf456]
MRGALKSKLLRRQAGEADVLAIDELGLAPAKSRVDVAVFNGHLHGYKIKSAGENLLRLPAQLRTYSEALEKLTFVMATRHISAEVGLILEWCDLIEIIEGPRGGIKLKMLRRSNLNPNVNLYIFAYFCGGRKRKN